MADTKTFKIENAQIIFRNFEGKEGPYNRAGARNFAVLIDDPAVAEAMAKDGWNVKFPEPKEEGDDPTPYISVEVSYKIKPPRVVMLTNGGKTRNNLGESEIEVLDWVDIAQVDLICNAYDWNVNGKTGVKAYLKTLFVTVEEDDLERKYAVNEEV